MAKRLQVILTDPEYQEIQRMARSRHCRSLSGSVKHWIWPYANRLAASTRSLRPSAWPRYDFPVSDIDGMLAEIERGIQRF